MAGHDFPDAAIVSSVLERLEKPGTDEYIMAFGPNGKQFFATPNGYSVFHLPLKVLGSLSTGYIKKVKWASYGSHPDSWFFAYEMVDGTTTIHIGPTIPAALLQFIDRISAASDLYSALRVQLGANDSFFAYTKTSWAAYGIPEALEAELCRMSWTHMRSPAVIIGSLKGTLTQIAWHGDGSYYVNGEADHFWHFKSVTTRQAWSKLWPKKNTLPSFEELSEMALVALDPHAPVGETFAFIKKQGDAQEAPFVIHFYQDVTHTTQDTTGTPEPAAEFHDTRLQYIEREPEKPKTFRWAISNRTGRPHPRESWELELKKKERVKVWEDRGRNWYIVEGRGGIKGWAHGTWLDLCGRKVRQDSKSTYAQFQTDMRKLLVPGQLREFPPLREYMSSCSIAACGSMRGGRQLGICVHDLQALLEGSGCYSYEWLKEERNVWHPDKFARYCDADYKEELKTCAQEVFVLYGVLMDKCNQQG